MKRMCSVMEQFANLFAVLVQKCHRLLRHGSLGLVIGTNLEAFPRGGVRAEQFLKCLDDSFDRGQEILFLQAVIEGFGRDVCPNDIGIDAVECDFLLGKIMAVRPHESRHTVFRRRIDRQGGNTVEPTDTRDTTDLSPEPILARLLLAELLHRQPHRVHDSDQVDFHGGQVWHLEARGARVVGNPGAFTNSRDRIDIVDAAKVCHSLTECFGLRVPTRDIDMSTISDLGILVELIHQLLSAFKVPVGDEYFDAR